MQSGRSSRAVHVGRVSRIALVLHFALGGSLALSCALLQAQGPASSPQRTPGGTGSAPPSNAAPETRMTKEQAKALFASVDDILGFVSKDSALPIEHSVKRKLISREEVTKFLNQNFDEDKGAQRLQRSEIVLKKFGLLDRDFHLRSFLVSLLTEQIAGFYDSKTKTVNLLDWIEPDQQKPVLAHELTHALQDQKVGLTKWSHPGIDPLAKNVTEDNQHIATDEGDTARDAVTEGQAMAVFFDWSLRNTGKTIADAPELLSKLKEQTSDPSASPLLARAPLLLQEALLFPYSEGLGFTQTLLIKGGKKAAFSGTLDNPPTSSYEIMNPDAYLGHRPIPVLHLPDIHPLLDAEYTPYDIGVMGELDVKILAELFGGRELAEGLAPEWNGGIYYAAQRKSATPAERETTGSIALLYSSRWKDADSARAFLKIYEGHLGRKYSRLEKVTPSAKNASGGKGADDPLAGSADGPSVTDETVYHTEEGDVVLSIKGNGVYISEGFPLELARELRTRITSVQSDGPLQLAGTGDPAVDLAHTVGSVGIMKAALNVR